MQIGVKEYQEALAQVHDALPSPETPVAALRMASEGLEVNIPDLLDTFRELSGMSMLILIPLFSRLFQDAFEDEALAPEIEAIKWALAMERVTAFAAGVRAGRMYPESPFDEAIDRMTGGEC